MSSYRVEYVSETSDEPGARISFHHSVPNDIGLVFMIVMMMMVIMTIMVMMMMMCMMMIRMVDMIKGRRRRTMSARVRLM